MFPNTELIKAFSRNDLDLLDSVSRLFYHAYKHIEESNQGDNMMYRCHTLCRAMAGCMSTLKVCDGYYLGVTLTDGNSGTKKVDGEGCDHSWLITPDESIIDIYPVGLMAFGGPLLVASRDTYKPFGANYYVPEESVTGRVMTPKMIEEADRLSKCFREAQQKLSRQSKTA